MMNYGPGKKKKIPLAEVKKQWSLGCLFTARFIEVVYRCVLTFPSGISLKVDFSYYPYKRLKPRKIDTEYLLVEDYTQLPRMIVSLNLDDLKKFFRKKAQEIGRTSVIS